MASRTSFVGSSRESTARADPRPDRHDPRCAVVRSPSACAVQKGNLEHRPIPTLPHSRGWYDQKEVLSVGHASTAKPETGPHLIGPGEF